MAYQPQGNEQAYVQDFEQNRSAIEAYKRRRGGSYEKAYQAVTGRPWPEGRSVKISNGRAEMTKDRTFKSILGKYVAPIGAGAATALTLGGAAPALAGIFGGGGGAAGAAGAAGSGIKGALSGLGAKDLGALGLIGAQLFGGGGSGGGGGDSLSGVGGGPALEDLLALQTSQAQRQDPLHQAVTQLATNLLPNSAFGAGPNRPLVR